MEGAGYMVMLTGDFNARIGNQETEIAGGDIVLRRRLLRLVRETRLCIVDKFPVRTGKWTWWSGNRQSIIWSWIIQRE